MGEAVILIPAYNPDGEFVRVVDDLASSGLRVVAVNDGSTSGVGFFDEARRGITKLLVHDVNRGKGAALKTGIAWIRENMPEADVVVTVDADGQHRPDDVRRIAAESLRHPGALVVGTRSFSGTVPLRCRIGNGWARFTFFALTHVPVRDTQSGLRGIPRRLFGRMLEIRGERYSYELRMLADSRFYDEPPVQVPIETVYLRANASSHFHPVRDALTTQCAFFFRCMASMLAFAADNVAYAACMWRFAGTGRPLGLQVGASIAVARLVGANLGYFCSRVHAFNPRPAWKSYFRGIGLAACMAVPAWAATTGVSALAGVGGVWTTAVKVAVEAVLVVLLWIAVDGFASAGARRDMEGRA